MSNLITAVNLTEATRLSLNGLFKMATKTAGRSSLPHRIFKRQHNQVDKKCKTNLFIEKCVICTEKQVLIKAQWTVITFYQYSTPIWLCCRLKILGRRLDLPAVLVAILKRPLKDNPVDSVGLTAVITFDIRKSDSRF